MEKRLMYLDRLKVFMTVLVVLHHTAIVYGGSGSWPYYEHQDSTVANVLLTMFTAVNQSFFMGLFFFISGYVTPASYDRQGGGSFLKARLFRYGIPLLFYMLAIVPLLRYAVSGNNGSLGAFLRDELFLHPLRGVIEFEVGPLWYLEALLLFFTGYVVFRQVTAGKPHSKPIALTGRLIACYVIVVAAANVLVRLDYPVGTEVLNLQLAYFPAYIGLFMGGVAAYRGQWLQRLTKEAGKRWAGAALLLIVCMAAGMALGGAVEGDVSAFMGGLTWQAAFYATIDPLMGLGISYALMIWFRERWNGAATGSTGWLTANAFLVYIVHALSVTYVAIAFRSLAWHPILKFVVVGCIAVMLSYTAATIIRRIPGVKKVI